MGFFYCTRNQVLGLLLSSGWIDTHIRSVVHQDVKDPADQGVFNHNSDINREEAK